MHPCDVHPRDSGNHIPHRKHRPHSYRTPTLTQDPNCHVTLITLATGNPDRNPSSARTLKSYYNCGVSGYDMSGGQGSDHGCAHLLPSRHYAILYYARYRQHTSTVDTNS